VEVLGLMLASLWLWLCGTAIAMATRATSECTVYNRITPREVTWQKRTRNKSVVLRLFEESKDSDILKREARSSPGEEALARSQLTAKKHATNEPAAASGNKE